MPMVSLHPEWIFRIEQCTCNRCGHSWTTSDIAGASGRATGMNSKEWEIARLNGGDINHATTSERRVPLCYRCFNPDEVIPRNLEIAERWRAAPTRQAKPKVDEAAAAAAALALLEM